MFCDGIYCCECDRLYDERELRFDSYTTESCPHCGRVVRTGTAMRMPSLSQTAIYDVIAIDHWLESYACNTGAEITRSCKGGDVFEWSIESAPWGQCTMRYSSDHLGVVGVALVSIENAELICDLFDTARQICARYGVEASCAESTTACRGVVNHEYSWHVSRILSTGHLLPALLDPVVEVLVAAQRAVIRELSEA